MSEPVVASAPAKVILLGEHAVVYGKPALALGIDLRMRVSARPYDVFVVNGFRMEERRHAYIAEAVRKGWTGPGAAKLETASEIPSASGLGSSAALTVATLGALAGLRGGLDEEQIARCGFEAEYAVQGKASPTDTSTSTHGRGVLVAPERRPDLLWVIEKGGRRWFVHHIDVPVDLHLVVGYTGVRSSTAEQVEKVRRFVERNTFAREVVSELGDLVDVALPLLRRGDLVALGEAMDRAHQLLSILGVSSSELDTLVEAARPLSYGAKLTGAGGGGSIIALTDEPKRVAARIEGRGARSFVVQPASQGVRLEAGSGLT